jgi:transposase
LSYCRLVKPKRESAGKLYGHSGRKIGNAHLKWAFGELATTFLRANPRAQQLHERLKKKHGKGKALAILAAKLARAVHLARTLDTQVGMTNEWLKQQGLISIRELWMKAHGYA